MQCKQWYREILWTLYPIFPNNNILQRYSTISQPKILIQSRYRTFLSSQEVIMFHFYGHTLPSHPIPATTKLFSISIILSFKKCYANIIGNLLGMAFSLGIILWSSLRYLWGFPGSSAGKEATCNAGDTGLIPGSGSSPGEGIDYPLQYSWASLVAQMVKNLPAMWKTWVWPLGWEDPVNAGMATHSSIVAWNIPWTEDSGGVQTMGLQSQAWLRD